MIYLNNAATTFPKPSSVLKAVARTLEALPCETARAGLEEQNEGILCHARCNLAEFFHVPDPNRMIFTPGATAGLNTIFRGLGLHGTHVVTTSTEHNSVLRPLKTMERENEISLTIVDCDKTGHVDPFGIEQAICKRTKLIVVNHCSNVTGVVQDIKQISEIAHTHSALLLVDASQSAGTIPIDAIAEGIDLLVFTGHKFLYGIEGIGGMYVRDGIDLQPLIIGGTGVQSDLLYQPNESPIRYEAGTPNIAGIASLSAGTEYIFRKGIDILHRRKIEVITHIVERLRKIPGVILYGVNGTIPESAILSLNIGTTAPEETGYILKKSFGIIVRTGLHCAPLIHRALGSSPKGTVRVSPSSFTTIPEAEAFCSAIEQISKMGKQAA